MKKIIAILAALVMIMGCFAGCDTDTGEGSSNTPSSSSSKAPSNGTTSTESKGEYVPYYEVPEGYCDVNAAVEKAGVVRGFDESEYFDKDAKGYAIYNGTYAVDAETLVMLTQKPVVGDGQVMWKDFSLMSEAAGSNDPLTGRIPVDKLHDPIFMSMALPSEIQTYMATRINATNMKPAEEKYRKLLPIGAIYKEKDTKLPDDAQITLCLGKVVLVGRTEEKGWHVASEVAHPLAPRHLYYLPWNLEHSVGTGTIPLDRITEYDDRVEIKLTGAMLNGTYNVPDKYKDQIEGSVLHFWGTNWTFDDGSKVQGAVVGIEAWIKEPEYVGKVALAIGADWRTATSDGIQAFSGINYKLTTEKRLAIGHNVGPKAYDKIMDTNKVQQLLGLK